MLLSDQLNREKEKEYIRMLDDSLEVNFLSGEQLKPFQNAVKPVYDYFVSKGDFSYDDIESARRKARKAEVTSRTTESRWHQPPLGQAKIEKQTDQIHRDPFVRTGVPHLADGCHTGDVALCLQQLYSGSEWMDRDLIRLRNLPGSGSGIWKRWASVDRICRGESIRQITLLH